MAILKPKTYQTRPLVQPPDQLDATRTTGRFVDEPARTLILIGASVRSAAQSIRRRLVSGSSAENEFVIGVDLFGDSDTRAAVDQMHVLKSSKDKKEDFPELKTDGQNANVLEVIAKKHPNGKWVIVGEWLGMIADLTNLAQIDLVPCLGAWTRAVDARTLLRAAATAGLRVPETSQSSSKTRQGEWLIKSKSRSGGLGVRRLDEAIGSIGSNEFLQRHVSGSLYGATYFCDSDRTELLGVCESFFHRVGAFPFVYSGSRGPVVDECLRRDALRDAGESIANSSGLKGLFNLDFIVDQGGEHWLLEVNPRWSASSEIVERALVHPDQSLLRYHIDGTMPTQRKSNDSWCKRIVFADDETVFNRGAAESALEPGDHICDIPSEGTVIGRGHPMYSIVGRTS